METWPFLLFFSCPVDHLGQQLCVWGEDGGAGFRDKDLKISLKKTFRITYLACFKCENILTMICF